MSEYLLENAICVELHREQNNISLKVDLKVRFSFKKDNSTSQHQQKWNVQRRQTLQLCRGHDGVPL